MDLIYVARSILVALLGLFLFHFDLLELHQSLLGRVIDILIGTCFILFALSCKLPLGLILLVLFKVIVLGKVEL